MRRENGLGSVVQPKEVEDETFNHFPRLKRLCKIADKIAPGWQKRETIRFGNLSLLSLPSNEGGGEWVSRAVVSGSLIEGHKADDISVALNFAETEILLLLIIMSGERDAIGRPVTFEEISEWLYWRKDTASSKRIGKMTYFVELMSTDNVRTQVWKLQNKLRKLTQEVGLNVAIEVFESTAKLVQIKGRIGGG